MLFIGLLGKHCWAWLLICSAIIGNSLRYSTVFKCNNFVLFKNKMVGHVTWQNRAFCAKHKRVCLAGLLFTNLHKCMGYGEDASPSTKQTIKLRIITLIPWLKLTSAG